MRTILGALVMMLVLGGVAGAQIVDPTTGITVDAASDPVDFTAIVSGQPGNAGMEANMAAIASMQASNAAAQASMQSMSESTDTTADAAPVDTSGFFGTARLRAPRTPKPVMTPSGGTFKGGGQVTIADRDSSAVVFYTTDGSKPTTSSARYSGPITVSAKTKVEALAFDVSEMPSGVVAKTFKVKGS